MRPELDKWQEGAVRVFDSVRTYVFAFCVYLLVALEKTYALVNRTSFRPRSEAGGTDVFLILVTICCFVYLVGLLRKTSSGIERAVLVLTEALCVLELTHLLAKLGAAWATIPNDQFVIAIIHFGATILVGIRVFQVAWRRGPMEEETL
jgi:hypothetical protein